MIRIILLFAFIVIFTLAVFAILAGIKSIAGPAQVSKGDTMPQTFQRIAYVVLIILMFGICAGLLGIA